MNIHIDLMISLMESIREIERVNGALTYSVNKEIFKEQFQKNEFYYSDKLINNNLTRYEYFKKSLVEKENSDYIRLFNLANSYTDIQEFDIPLIKEYMKLYKVSQMDLTFMQSVNEKNFSQLLTAISLFRKSYISFPIIKHKIDFATIVMNSYLKKNGFGDFSVLLSEVIFKNYSIFQSSIGEKERFNIVFLKLIVVEMQKMSSRFKMVESLINENHKLLEDYGSNIENYISREMIFTITDFVAKNDISYNTGKKYLKELVEKGVLESVKIGKHNGYVYSAMLSIWMK